MAEPDVVIVAQDGTRHRFPSGFDPQQAAAIVRQQSTGVPSVSAVDMLSGKVGRDPGSAEGADWGQSIAQAGESMAHPKTAADVAGLLIPAGGGKVVSGVLNAIGGKNLTRIGMGGAGAAYGAATGTTPHNRFERAAVYGTAGAFAPSLIGPAGGAAEHLAPYLPVKVKAMMGALTKINPSEWNSPLTVAGREGRAVAASQAFNAQPLEQQMAHLPTTGPNPIRRFSGNPPAVQGTVNDLPLEQQMAHLPTTGRMPEGRPTPPPASTFRFNDQPLHQQMDRLPTTGGVSSARSTAPPMQPQTPFHERPLYQQMTELPTTAAPVPSRGPAPPYQPSLAAPAAPTPAAPTSSPTSVEPAVEDLLRARGLDPSRMVRSTPTPNARPTSFSQTPMGPLRPMAAHGQPSETRIAEMTQKFGGTAPDVPHPDQVSRLDIGADRLVRDTGESPTALRTRVGPAGGEARGASREVFPNAPSDRMTSDMLQLPPEERRAWMLRGTSEKTRSQTETMTRFADTIRQARETMAPADFEKWIKLFAVTGAAGPSLRDALLGMMSSHGPQAEGR